MHCKKYSQYGSCIKGDKCNKIHPNASELDLDIKTILIKSFNLQNSILYNINENLCEIGNSLNIIHKNISKKNKIQKESKPEFNIDCHELLQKIDHISRVLTKIDKTTTDIPDLFRSKGVPISSIRTKMHMPGSFSPKSLFKCKSRKQPFYQQLSLNDRSDLIRKERTVQFKEKSNKLTRSISLSSLHDTKKNDNEYEIPITKSFISSGLDPSVLDREVRLSLVDRFKKVGSEISNRQEEEDKHDAKRSFSLNLEDPSFIIRRSPDKEYKTSSTSPEDSAPNLETKQGVLGAVASVFGIRRSTSTLKKPLKPNDTFQPSSSQKKDLDIETLTESFNRNLDLKSNPRDSNNEHSNNSDYHEFETDNIYESLDDTIYGNQAVINSIESGLAPNLNDAIEIAKEDTTFTDILRGRKT